MEYSYNIINVDASEHWIFISHEDWDDPDGFISLVKKIRDDCNVVIVNLGDTQYKIDGDGMDLIYQYDVLLIEDDEYPGYHYYDVSLFKENIKNKFMLLQCNYSGDLRILFFIVLIAKED